MLTVNQTADSISHSKAAGKRASGHFDHDANQHAGPSVSYYQNNIKHDKANRAENYIKEDPETGEVIFAHLD